MPREPGDLEAQVDEVLNAVTRDLEVWAAMANKHRIDLFCGLFMATTDEGLEVSPRTLGMLAERRIKLALCIYAPTGLDHPPGSSPDALPTG
jgi:hypothetical protein